MRDTYHDGLIGSKRILGVLQAVAKRKCWVYFLWDFCGSWNVTRELCERPRLIMSFFPLLCDFSIRSMCPCLLSYLSLNSLFSHVCSKTSLLPGSSLTCPSLFISSTPLFFSPINVFQKQVRRKGIVWSATRFRYAMLSFSINRQK